MRLVMKIGLRKLVPAGKANGHFAFVQQVSAARAVIRVEKIGEVAYDIHSANKPKGSKPCK
jgi:hypothetical protein